MTIIPDTPGADEIDELAEKTERVRTSTGALNVDAAAFARVMSKAFADATAGGRQFDDVLKQMALRLSSMAVGQAFRPLARGLSGSPGKLFDGLFGDGDTGGRPQVIPFASGGVIGAPGYFPLAAGGLGLAGEAGPEAIMPLARGTDGRLGVAMSGGAAASVTVHIATPDAASFRRSEAYITGQIARAVARGQRGL
ncbi:MAG: phage tail tape measure protein [Pseudolabrys sp.]